jgi:hypothetical protein
MQKIKKKIVTNFYSCVLWNTRVFGSKNRELTPTNFYEKEVEVEQTGVGEILSIKSDLIQSGVQKANPFEVGILKYLLLAVFAYIFFKPNLYYVSMTGMCVGAFAYLGFYQIKKRVSTFFAYFFLLILFVIYMSVFALYPAQSVEYKVNWMINYSVQYFLWFFLFERVFIDLYTLDFLKWYKIDKLFMTYFKVIDKESISLYESKKKQAQKIFTFFLIGVFFLSLFFGGVNLTTRIVIDQKAKVKILINNGNEKEILRQKNSEALLQILESQSKELGIRVHTKDDIELLRHDFKKYLNVGVIAYEEVRISSGNTFEDISTNQRVFIKFQKPYYIVRAWVKKYSDDQYRWHFKYDDKIFVIMNTKAR